MRLHRLRFRFTDPDDIAAYGGDWWLWDEPAVARLRGRELIDLEELIGRPVIQVIRGLRGEDTLATMAAMWLSLHRAGHAVAWDAFEPAVNMVDWEEAPDPLGSSGADLEAESDSSAAPTTESATS